MKIIFFGTSEFAVPSLVAVKDHVVLVVSQPDRPSGRGLKLLASPMSSKARELGIPVLTPEKSRSPEFIEQIKSLGADLNLVAAYGQIFSARLLETSKFGSFNLHGSILPKFRGAAPIQRCLLAGELETGVSFMKMNQGMDTGDVIAISKTPIDPMEVYGTLQTRLADTAADLASKWLPRLAKGDFELQPQNSELATMAPKIEKSETIINLGGDAYQEFNRFRAFSPNPGVSLETRFGPLKIKDCHLTPASGTPGEVIAMAPDLQVAIGSRTFALIKIQPAGKSEMSGRDWANGHRLKIGDSIV